MFYLILKFNIKLNKTYKKGARNMFFVFCKIITLFILPFGLFLALSFVNILIQNIFLNFILLSTLYLISIGNFSKLIFKYAEKPWKRISEKNIDNANAIVVLSGDGPYIRGPNRTIEFGNRDRFNAAINLYKKGKAPLIVFTSTALGAPINNFQLETGNTFLEEARKSDIPNNDLKKTSIVRNTIEEINAIKNIISKSCPNNNPKIILITSALHMTRAKNLLQKKGISVLPYPVEFKTDFFNKKAFIFKPEDYFPSVEGLQKSSEAIKEIYGRIIYRFF